MTAVLSSLDRLVSPARASRIGVMVAVATLLTLLLLFFTRNGLLDYAGRPLGTDFSGAWTGGMMARLHGAATAYDFVAHNQLQQTLFSTKNFFLGYHYPPVFTFVMEPLSALPYGVALAVYLSLGLAVYIYAMRHVLAPLSWHHWLWPVLGFPAVWVNCMHGQNGFLSAALFGLGLAWLPTRTILAGICLGLMCYKPQFGLLVPLALLAGRQWTAFLSASVTVTALCLTSYVYHGEEAWRAFLAYSEFTRTDVIEHNPEGMFKMQTLLAALRLWGAPAALCYTAYALWLVMLASVVVRVWQSSCDHSIKSAVLIMASLLAAPYMFDYDFMILAPALGFFVQHVRHYAPQRHDLTMLAVVWLLPFLARPVAQMLHIPVGFMVMSVWFFWLYRSGNCASKRLQTTP